MLNSLRSVNLPTLVALLSAVFGIGWVGLWFVRKTTGRTIREMLALLAAGFVLIAFMAPLVIYTDDWLNSPDRAIHDLVKMLLTTVFLALALVVSQLFNRLAKPRQRANSRGKGRHHHYEPIG